MCLFFLLLLFGPRLVDVLWWLFDPLRWHAVFGTFLVPLLGVIFLPWTTLVYVLVAPGGVHLVVERSGRVALTQAPPVHGVRPAADVTFKAVAQGYGARAVGVVLTGMGRDGALGLAAIKAAGGRTVAQDRPTSTVYGMPRAALDMGVVDDVVSLDRLGRVVTDLVG